MMIRILVADDQAMIRSAVSTLIGLEDDIEVVAQAGSCPEALAFAHKLSPDVAVVDVQMPGDATMSDGIDLAARIVRELPSTKVVIVTTFGRPGYLRRAMESGASGFLVKDAPADRLIDSIRRVGRGERVVDPELAAASLSIGRSPLSAKETEVLRAASLGGTTHEVAARVYLSEGTVRNHLSAAIGKLGGANRAEAVRIATDNGWL